MQLPVKFVIISQSQVATSSFNEASRDIRRSIDTARANDVRFGILLPGKDQDAVVLAAKMGIADRIVAARGVESFSADIRQSHGSVLHSFLHGAGFYGMYENVLLLDDNQKRIDMGKTMGMRCEWASAADGSPLPPATPVFQYVAKDAVTYMRTRHLPGKRLTA